MGDAYSWGGVSSTEEISLPVKLRLAGYKTYAVGKWHIGYGSWKHVPAGRGFHRYFGNWENGDHFEHCTMSQHFDLHYEESEAWEQPTSSPDNIYHRYVTNETGNYKAEIYDRTVQEFLVEHKRRFPMHPFFMYYPMYLIRAAQAPTESPLGSKGARNYFDDCRMHVNEQRQVVCASLAAIDDAVENVSRFLENTFADENYVVIMTGDNGGSTWWQGSSNVPLKGNKGENFEGGIRNHVLIWGNHPDVQQVAGTTYSNSPMHLVDWHATIMELARSGLETMPVGDRAQVGYCDGTSVWHSIMTNSFLQNAQRAMIWAEDDGDRGKAIRKGDYKLVMDIRVGRDPAWIPDVNSPGRKLWGLNWPLMDVSRSDYHARLDALALNTPVAWVGTLLYNIRQDPGETNDLSTEMPDVVASMRQEFQHLVDSARRSSGTTDFSCGWDCWNTVDYNAVYAQMAQVAFPHGGNPCVNTGALYPAWDAFPPFES